MSRLEAGLHYPNDLGDFRAWFRTDEDCLDYLAWLRWGNGFVCPACGARGEPWVLGDGRFMCPECQERSSVTAGTIFHRTRTPLTVWFSASWLFATGKDGISALSLKRTLNIGSYQTAWAMLHKLRSALVNPDRSPLGGIVEVDETFIGGPEAGLLGGRERGKKALVAVAVEVREPRGIGRGRMKVIPDASGASLLPFVKERVAPGTRVITDGWSGYIGLEKLGFVHEPRSQRAAKHRGEDPNQLLPAVHRVASLTKRWLLGTHQGSVSTEHLPSYLDEFVFRFNRRTSRSRGLVFYRLLERAVNQRPVPYRELVARRKPRPGRPPPKRRKNRPPSLDRPNAERPWRLAPPPHSG